MIYKVIVLAILIQNISCISCFYECRTNECSLDSNPFRDCIRNKDICKTNINETCNNDQCFEDCKEDTSFGLCYQCYHNCYEKSGCDEANKTTTIVVAVCCSVAAVFVIVTIIICIIKRRKLKQQNEANSRAANSKKNKKNQQREQNYIQATQSTDTQNNGQISVPFNNQQHQYPQQSNNQQVKEYQ